MTIVQILMLVVLVVMFIAATKWPINIGLMGLVGAFVFGTLAFGMDDKEILEEFPSSIILTIIGVTFFFSLAQKNGTIKVLVDLAIRAVHGRVNIVPWIFFVVASALTSLGTFSPAAVALLAPAAMSFSATTGYSAIVMGAMVINGAHAGGFSPISVSGNIVTDIAESNGFEINSGGLFLASYIVNLLVTILTVMVMKMLKRLRSVPEVIDRAFDAETGPRSRAAGEKERAIGATRSAGKGGSLTVTDPVPSSVGITRSQWLTIALMVLMVIAAVGLMLPIGFVGLTAGLVLAFTTMKTSDTFVSGISWPTVLLVSGMIVYVSLLTHAGVIDSLSTMAVSIGIPIIVAFVLCYVIGITSAFASSTALLTAFIPLAIPLLEQSHLSATGVMAALAVSATIVDVSPFSTDGALIIANAQGRAAKTIWRDLMIYAGFVVLLAPLLTWLLLVPTGIM